MARKHWQSGDVLLAGDLEGAFVELETAINGGTPGNGNGTPGGATGTAQSAILTSNSLPPSGRDSVKSAKLARVLALSKVTTSRAAWVRLYADEDSRLADLDRGRGSDPAEGTLVALEFTTQAGALSLPTPNVSLSDAQTTNAGLPATIVNLDGAAGTVVVTFDFLSLQAYAA
jgi:hypothetical protein